MSLGVRFILGRLFAGDKSSAGGAVKEGGWWTSLPRASLDPGHNMRMMLICLPKIVIFIHLVTVSFLLLFRK